MSAASLRLLMATPRYLPHLGGVENHVHQVSRRLARDGVDVTVLTTDPGSKLPSIQHAEGVRIVRVSAWPANRDYHLAPDLYRIISGGSWDIVHVQSYHTLVAPMAMLAALRARTPYVVTFHGGGHSSRLRNVARPMQRTLLRPLLARAKRLIALARFEVDLYSRELGIPRERFVLIPNGSDLPAVMPREGRLRSDKALIVSVGRLERYKGHQNLIAALPRVASEEPDARVLILGSGPYEQQLRQLAGELGVADRVEIKAIPASERQAMSDQLSRASLFVLLSEQETHPIAVLEALSLGCPTLVADSQGLRELAEIGLARAIPANSSPGEVAAAVLGQLRNPLKPGRVELPTWDECAASLLALYRSIAQHDSKVSGPA